jgi:prepilin-type N-terminal cleavage/methylation domain-containing protein
MQTPRKSQIRSHGFTLIELLTVIAIIGILAAIIIPTVGKVRESANQTKALSNVREVTKASLIFSAENKGYAPSPQFNSQVWSLLYPYVSGSNAAKSAVMWDPTTGLTNPNNPSELPAQFSFNAWFHYRLTDNSWNSSGPYKLSDVKAPSKIILIADGSFRGTSNGSDYQIWAETAQSGESDALLPVSDNLAGNAGFIAYRAKKNTGAKIGFVDGHVTIVDKGTLLNYNMNPTHLR